MKLREIDLSKGSGHEHPDISINCWYLAEIQYRDEKPRYAAGTFYRQWYGWNFSGFYDAGMQFDTPGTNASAWKRLWEIVPRKPKKKAPRSNTPRRARRNVNP